MFLDAAERDAFLRAESKWLEPPCQAEEPPALFVGDIPAQPCDKCTCGHRNDAHNGEDLMCWEPGCTCEGFQLPKRKEGPAIDPDEPEYGPDRNGWVG